MDFYEMTNEKWGAGRLAPEVALVLRALEEGRQVQARLDGPHHDAPGTMVEVRLSRKGELYGGVAGEGYVLEGEGWQVDRSGGGFWNPHTIIIDKAS